MTIKELQELKEGTLVYNGRTEGIIKMDGRIKVIEIYIPLYAMSNDSNNYDERPASWSTLED